MVTVQNIYITNKSKHIHSPAEPAALRAISESAPAPVPVEPGLIVSSEAVSTPVVEAVASVLRTAEPGIPGPEVLVLRLVVLRLAVLLHLRNGLKLLDGN